MLSENAVAVRTKAMKCLTAVIEADPGVLARVSINNWSLALPMTELIQSQVVSGVVCPSVPIHRYICGLQIWTVCHLNMSSDM